MIIGDAIVTTTISDDEATKIWDIHLEHMSENEMIVLSKKGLLKGQRITKLKLYENCLFRKYKS